jgi:L-phenylalanine/L-methionine N-acetyltransferase
MEEMMTNERALAAPGRLGPPGLTVRAREPTDLDGFAELMSLPKVRWGTLRLPLVSREQYRKWLESPPEGMTAIVAVLDGRIVGSGDIRRGQGRSAHVGSIGMCVHDDFHGRGIGSAMLAALVDAADNWLDLKRLELRVYVDNAPAIRLYSNFGFEVEGTLRADAFRAGVYVDSHIMGRIRRSGP